MSVTVATAGPGQWRPGQLCPAHRASNVGLLVVSGVLVREMRLLDPPSAELFGPGDIIRTWHADAAPQMVSASTEWRALERTSVAVMDGSTAMALRSYPEVMAVVLDRLNARAERLAVTQAISQITGVETRVEALLWHLSQRWGKVGRDGVIVGLGALAPHDRLAGRRPASDGLDGARGLWTTGASCGGRTGRGR